MNGHNEITDFAIEYTIVEFCYVNRLDSPWMKWGDYSSESTKCFTHVYET